MKLIAAFLLLALTTSLGFAHRRVVKPLIRAYPDWGAPAPADTGARTVFHTESYSGSPESKLLQAGTNAAAVSGAVIIDQIYELSSTVLLYNNVLYTGGGLRRTNSTYTQVATAALSSDNFVHVNNTAGFRTGNIVINTNTSETGTLGRFVVASVDAMNSRLYIEDTFGVNIPLNANVFHEFALAEGNSQYSSNIVLDSILFDGNVQSNSWTHDWNYNNTLYLRGSNIVRNCFFVHTPSENITACGGHFTNNSAYNLAGSFIHKSCASGKEASDFVVSNYLEKVNQIGNAIMGHSEGAITFSANSANTYLQTNYFRFGNEAVMGKASASDLPVYSSSNRYESFPRFVVFNTDGDPDDLHSTNDTLVNVPLNPPVLVPATFSKVRGSAALVKTLGVVSDQETHYSTISVTALTLPNYVTVTDIFIQNGGTTKGTVFADTLATLGANTITFEVEDVTGISANYDLTFTVTD